MAMARLEQLAVVPVRPSIGGYVRGCGSDQACVFGPAWSDDVDVPGGHNGCGTRDDVLARQLTEVAIRPGSRCVVVAGTLHDPYTGRILAFAKATAGEVQIDHVVPLAMAWDLGAAEWTADQRRNFANDPENLLAVDGPTNQAKGAQGPGGWMPPNAAFRCGYSEIFVSVLAKYQLPVTLVDAAALRSVLAGCA